MKDSMRLRCRTCGQVYWKFVLDSFVPCPKCDSADLEVDPEWLEQVCPLTRGAVRV